MTNLKKITCALIAAGIPMLGYAQSTSKENSQWDGFVSGAIGGTAYGGDYTSNNFGGVKNTGPSGEARVSVAYTDKSGFGAQIDNLYSENVLYTNFDNYRQRSSLSSFDFAAHGFYRTKDYLAGIYVQRTSFDVKYSGNGESGGTSLDRAYFLGGEGQLYFNKSTVYAQVGYQNYGFTDTGPAYSTSSPAGYNTSLTGRYFVKDNWRVDAGFDYGLLNSTYANSGFYASSKQTSTQLNLGTEYRLDNSPISFFGKFQNSSSSLAYSNTSVPNLNFKSSLLLVGIKFTFGTGSLLDQDRRGASLNPVNSRVPYYYGFGPS